ncbi:hypothetical protein E2562_013352 [Oryza meyeriana var. granulata]|uniref:Uncharacterized protein n=1 Tax=Oryza meyeriana var. granulata TaxID=110450 RepID=A0A6G1CGF0_9ORYZ|nr:hypothetical protein E2562_013352 [Oryza meyeriana var. granulata]
MAQSMGVSAQTFYPWQEECLARPSAQISTPMSVARSLSTLAPMSLVLSFCNVLGRSSFAC